MIITGIKTHQNGILKTYDAMIVGIIWMKGPNGQNPKHIRNISIKGEPEIDRRGEVEDEGSVWE